MLVLNFHRIEPLTGLEITRLSPGRFRRLLDGIAESGRRVGAGGGDPAAESGQVLLTFDDGFASIGRHALSEIVRRGWSAIVFLVAGAVGKADDWDIRLLRRARPMLSREEIQSYGAQGIEFGSHTLTHADLTALSARALANELTESKTRIEDIVQRPVRYISYPFGRHNTRVREAAREAGYSAGFATHAGGGTHDRWAIPRVTVHGLFTLFELRALLDQENQVPEGLYWHGRWRNRVFSSLSAGSAVIVNRRRAAR